MNMFEMIESFPSQIKNQHNSLLDFQFDLSNYANALLSYQSAIMTDSTYIRPYINRIETPNI